MRTNLRQGALALAALAAAAFFASARPARAQLPTPADDEVNAIAGQLFCPVCENTPLDVCPTEACRQWRDLIRQMLAEGKTAEEIKQYFVDNYGARVLSEPPRAGLGWLVYLVPPGSFLLGALLLGRAFVLWRRQGRAAAGVAAPAPGSRRSRTPEDVYAARLEEELRRRE
jgi:cytochrome c-type biogenesis protein CcmH